jgi:hypothetical protein
MRDKSAGKVGAFRLPLDVNSPKNKHAPSLFYVARFFTPKIRR